MGTPPTPILRDLDPVMAMHQILDLPSKEADEKDVDKVEIETIRLHEVSPAPPPHYPPLHTLTPPTFTPPPPPPPPFRTLSLPEGGPSPPPSPPPPTTHALTPRLHLPQAPHPHTHTSIQVTASGRPPPPPTGYNPPTHRVSPTHPLHPQGTTHPPTVYHPPTHYTHRVQPTHPPCITHPPTVYHPPTHYPHRVGHLCVSVFHMSAEQPEAPQVASGCSALVRNSFTARVASGCSALVRSPLTAGANPPTPNLNPNHPVTSSQVAPGPSHQAARASGVSTVLSGEVMRCGVERASEYAHARALQLLEMKAKGHASECVCVRACVHVRVCCSCWR